ncbi:MAG: rhomboid family intramembrane serine protease [Anaerolineaceae bacterium]|nr:rhomboid family intramembrane serine protease [Anaerolineaceae bacterium]
MLPIGDDNSQRRRFPIVTYALIAINIYVFFLELMGGDAFIYAWAFIPVRYLSNPIDGLITLFTSMFLHAGWMHLGGNMLYLLIFGDNVEDRFGHFKFLIFYVLCGLAAGLAQYAVSLYSESPTLGASGAIAGVLAAYLILFPGKRVRVILAVWIVNLPALLVIGAWIVIQLVSGLGTLSDAATGGVAYMAHIGGFAAGLILTAFFRKRAQQITF